MKKYIFSALFLLTCIVSVNAQYKPTKSDIGKDCTTEKGKLGTWKEVQVIETVSGSKNNSTSNSRSHNFGVGGNVGGEVKSAGVSGSVGGNANYGYSNSKGTSNSSSTTNTVTRNYSDIQCVEDQNAKLPQRSPVRW